MALAKTRRRAKSTTASHKSSHSEAEDYKASQETAKSQEVDEETIATAVRQHIEKSNARKQQREAEIETISNQRIADVRRQMDDCRAAHREKIRKQRQPKINRLRTLLQRKHDFEAKLAEYHNALDRTYDATLQQYQMVVQHRLEDLTH